VNAIQRQAPGLDEETFAKRTAEKEAALAAALEKHRRYASIARIVVAPEVRTFLSKFAEQFNTAKTIDERANAAHKAWVEVLDVARADLLGEPRETPPDAREQKS